MSQFERANNNILSGKSARYLITPAMTGVPAVGVVLTSGAGAWGAAADLIAAAAIAVEHYICGFFINTLGAFQIFELQVGGATPATDPIYSARLDPTAVTPNLGMLTVPYPIWRPANQQTSARAGGAAAKVIGVSTLYSVAL
jgi:hypothetical protein